MRSEFFENRATVMNLGISSYLAQIVSIVYFESKYFGK